MNGKIYLIGYTVIVAIMMVFDWSASLKDMLIAFLIILVQVGFDRLRRRKQTFVVLQDLAHSEYIYIGEFRYCCIS